MNQLRQIFDRINIVVRRRADQTDTGRAVANPRDVFIDLSTWQLSAFARLGTLRDFDLNLIGVGQVFDRDAESTRGDLLDRRSFGIAVFQGLETDGIFAAFAGIALAAQAVHRDRQRFVRLGADTAKAHRAGAKSFDDFAGRFDFFQR